MVNTDRINIVLFDSLLFDTSTRYMLSRMKMKIFLFIFVYIPLINSMNNIYSTKIEIKCQSRFEVPVDIHLISSLTNILVH
jgi:hypothetical protein